MNQKTSQATHPDMMNNIDNDIFVDDEVRLFYSHKINGCAPLKKSIDRPNFSEPESAKGQPFLIYRELGTFNVWDGNGKVVIDGETIELAPSDAFYNFIWAMTGENLDCTDMKVLDICQLK